MATTGPATYAHTETQRDGTDDILDRGLGDVLARGALAGLFGGLVFLVSNMGWAVHNGKPAVAPMIDISTIFHHQDMPKPIAAGPFGTDNVVVGLVTHLTLSMLFGIVFALLASMFLRRRPTPLLAVAGVAYGLAL